MFANKQLVNVSWDVENASTAPPPTKPSPEGDTIAAVLLMNWQPTKDTDWDDSMATAEPPPPVAGGDSTMALLPTNVHDVKATPATVFDTYTAPYDP